MFNFETNIRVRYAETDQMGYVYYGNYATYYEVARVEMLRSMGWPYKSLEQMGIMMPVTELHCQYIKPVFYDDHIKVRVSIPELPVTRIRFEYEIINEQNEIVNKGSTVLVFVDMKNNRPCRAPDEFLAKLQAYGVVS